MDETMAKRRRLWNPAVEEKQEGGGQQGARFDYSMPQMDSQRAAAFALATLQQQMLHHQHQLQQQQQAAAALPLLLQPYLSMMPLLAQSMQPVSPLLATPQHRPPPQVTLPPASPAAPATPSLSSSPLTPPPSLPASVLSPPSLNPLVQSALGVHVPNENCCAICGAAFRLTADLVTHMRNNHRKSRFKRKSDC